MKKQQADTLGNDRVDLKSYWLTDRYGKRQAILAENYYAAQQQAAALLTEAGLVYPLDVLTLEEVVK